MKVHIFLKYFQFGGYTFTPQVFWKKTFRLQGDIKTFSYFALGWPFREQSVGIYLFKVNNKNTRTRCEICSKLTIKTPERHYWLLTKVAHRLANIHIRKAAKCILLSQF